jgi:hypothetical protein
MVTIPILRWGQPYSSMDADEVKHFLTGEPIARVGRANGDSWGPGTPTPIPPPKGQVA